MGVNFKNIVECRKCGNMGFIIFDENGNFRNEAIYCDCYNKRRALLALHKSGLEDNVRLMRFDNFTVAEAFQRDMLDACQRFIAQDESKFLYIGGQSGCGKTHLGTAVCAEFINRGMSTIYTTFKMLMVELKSKVNDADYADALHKYANVPVLYIDDFMKFAPTKADIDHSFELINLRAVQDKITILTSEKSLDEVIAIDEALGGRIKEKCGEFALNITKRDGRNWRLRERRSGAD